jgi:large subunit ribosomal protein L29
MRADEIREMTVADIRTRIAELEEERFRLKFRSATEQLEDPLRLRWIRRDVARLQTILREKTQTEPVADGAAAKTTARRRTRATHTAR